MGWSRIGGVVRFPFEGGTLLHGFEASFQFHDLVLVVCFHLGPSVHFDLDGLKLLGGTFAVELDQ